MTMTCSTLHKSDMLGHGDTVTANTLLPQADGLNQPVIDTRTSRNPSDTLRLIIILDSLRPTGTLKPSELRSPRSINTDRSLASGATTDMKFEWFEFEFYAAELPQTGEQHGNGLGMRLQNPFLGRRRR